LYLTYIRITKKIGRRRKNKENNERRGVASLIDWQVENYHVIKIVSFDYIIEFAEKSKEVSFLFLILSE